MSRFLQACRYLQQYRGLSNSRLAADEHHRSAYDSTTEDEIELCESRFPPWLRRSADIAEPNR
jgi:hypothetical protein